MILMYIFLWALLFSVNTSATPPRRQHCEGWWPSKEICLELGTGRPNMAARSTENSGCPQWQIYHGWSGRKAFLNKLRRIEAIARQQPGMETSREELAKCGLHAS